MTEKREVTFEEVVDIMQEWMEHYGSIQYPEVDIKRRGVFSVDHNEMIGVFRGIKNWLRGEGKLYQHGKELVLRKSTIDGVSLVGEEIKRRAERFEKQIEDDFYATLEEERKIVWNEETKRDKILNEAMEELYGLKVGTKVRFKEGNKIEFWTPQQISPNPSRYVRTWGTGIDSSFCHRIKKITDSEILIKYSIRREGEIYIPFKNFSWEDYEIVEG